MSVGPSPDYQLIASELNPAGYSLDFCYVCNVQPTGLASITPFNHSMTIVQDPLDLKDCSKALSKKSIIIPDISFNSTTDFVQVFNSYEIFFDHKFKEYC